MSHLSIEQDLQKIREEGCSDSSFRTIIRIWYLFSLRGIQAMGILQEFVLSWMVDFIRTTDQAIHGALMNHALSTHSSSIQAFHLSLSFILPSGSYLSGN